MHSIDVFRLKLSWLQLSSLERVQWDIYPRYGQTGLRFWLPLPYLNSCRWVNLSDRYTKSHRGTNRDVRQDSYCHRFWHNLDTILQELQTRLMIPDIDQLILGLVAYRHRHNIQTGGNYLTVTISTRPTNGLFA